MKNKDVLNLVFLLAILLLLVGITMGITKVVKYVEKTEREYLDKISAYSSSLSSCQRRAEDEKETLNTCRKFVYERCVCVRWDSSEEEEPMTKDEVCNYPLDMGEYTEEFGYSSFQYWKPELGRYK